MAKKLHYTKQDLEDIRFEFDTWAEKNIKDDVITYVLERDPVQKEGLKKKLLYEVIDFFFSRFERDLKDNGGYVVRKVTWAEFVLAGLMESTNVFMKLYRVQKKFRRWQHEFKKLSTCLELKNTLRLTDATKLFFRVFKKLNNFVAGYSFNKKKPTARQRPLKFYKHGP